jgi:hypothetical protein
MAIELTQIGGTTLYAPNGGETYVFFLWDAASPPPSIPMGDTWANEGAPERAGYYVFLLAVPTPGDAPALETRLRTLFSAPDTTGFGWVAATDALSTAVELALDTAEFPIIAADTPVHLPPQAMPFTFSANLPVLGMTASDGTLNGFVMTQPRPQNPATAVGVSIALSGPVAGCIHFTGALESAVIGTQAIKRLADVLIDPLRLTDKNRTRIKPTGVSYTLTQTSTGYTFYPS